MSERDLRFTRPESLVFLNQVMQLKLALEDVAALETRTEGRITGLQLAVIAIQEDPRGDSTRAFIESLRSRLTTLYAWCTDFPELFLQSRPGLTIFLAWAMMLTFRMDLRDAIQMRLAQVEKMLEQPDLPAVANLGPEGVEIPLRQWIAGHVCAIRSQLLLADINCPGDPPGLIEISLKSLELLPEQEQPILATCTITLAHA